MLTNGEKSVKHVEALAWACGTFAVLCGLTGCLVAGYSSTGGGGFIWPGGLGLVVVLFLIWFLFGRRR